MDEQTPGIVGPQFQEYPTPDPEILRGRFLAGLDAFGNERQDEHMIPYADLEGHYVGPGDVIHLIFDIQNLTGRGPYYLRCIYDGYQPDPNTGHLYMFVRTDSWGRDGGAKDRFAIPGAILGPEVGVDFVVCGQCPAEWEAQAHVLHNQALRGLKRAKGLTDYIPETPARRPLFQTPAGRVEEMETPAPYMARGLGAQEAAALQEAAAELDALAARLESPAPRTPQQQRAPPPPQQQAPPPQQRAPPPPQQRAPPPPQQRAPPPPPPQQRTQPHAQQQVPTPPRQQGPALEQVMHQVATVLNEQRKSLERTEGLAAAREEYLQDPCKHKTSRKVYGQLRAAITAEVAQGPAAAIAAAAAEIDVKLQDVKLGDEAAQELGLLWFLYTRACGHADVESAFALRVRMRSVANRVRGDEKSDRFGSQNLWCKDTLAPTVEARQTADLLDDKELNAGPKIRPMRIGNKMVAYAPYKSSQHGANYATQKCVVGLTECSGGGKNANAAPTIAMLEQIADSSGRIEVRLDDGWHSAAVLTASGPGKKEKGKIRLRTDIFDEDGDPAESTEVWTKERVANEIHEVRASSSTFTAPLPPSKEHAAAQDNDAAETVRATKAGSWAGVAHGPLETNLEQYEAIDVEVPTPVVEAMLAKIRPSNDAIIFGPTVLKYLSEASGPGKHRVTEAWKTRLQNRPFAGVVHNVDHYYAVAAVEKTEKGTKKMEIQVMDSLEKYRVDSKTRQTHQIAEMAAKWYDMPATCKTVKVQRQAELDCAFHAVTNVESVVGGGGNAHPPPAGEGWTRSNFIRRLGQANSQVREEGQRGQPRPSHGRQPHVPPAGKAAKPMIEVGVSYAKVANPTNNGPAANQRKTQGSTVSGAKGAGKQCTAMATGQGKNRRCMNPADEGHEQCTRHRLGTAPNAGKCEMHGCPHAVSIGSKKCAAHEEQVIKAAPPPSYAEFLRSSQEEGPPRLPPVTAKVTKATDGRDGEPGFRWGVTVPHAATVTRYQLTQLQAAAHDAAPALATRGLSPETRAAHVRMLRTVGFAAASKGWNFAGPEWPATDFLIRWVESMRLAKRWKWSTTKTKLATLAGAMANIPLYLPSWPVRILLAETPVWKQAVRAADIQAAIERPTQADTLSLSQVEELLASDSLKAATKEQVAVMWMTAGRPGCVTQLKHEDICETATGELCITFRRGKTVKLRGQPYAVHTTMGKLKPWLEPLLKRHRTASPTAFVWPTETKNQRRLMIDDILAGVRLAGEQYECRSLRRGALQTMARQGASAATLMHFSGHSTVAMLKRYLGFGVLLTDEGNRIRAEAGKLTAE